MDETTVIDGACFGHASLRRASLDGVSASDCDFSGAYLGGATATFATFRRCDFTKAGLTGADGLCAFGARFLACHYGDRTPGELAALPAAQADCRLARTIRALPRVVAKVAVTASVTAVEHIIRNDAFSSAMTAAATLLATGTPVVGAVAGAVGRGVHAVVIVPLVHAFGDRLHDAHEWIGEEAREWLREKAGEKLDAAQDLKIARLSLGDRIREAAVGFAERFAMTEESGWRRRYVAALFSRDADRRIFRKAISVLGGRNPEIAAFGDFSTDLGHIVICHADAAARAAELIRKVTLRAEMAAKGLGSSAVQYPSPLTFISASAPPDPDTPSAITLRPDGWIEATWLSPHGNAIMRRVCWNPSGEPAAVLERRWFGMERRSSSEAPSLADTMHSFAAAQAAVPGGHNVDAGTLAAGQRSEPAHSPGR